MRETSPSEAGHDKISGRMNYFIEMGE